MKNVAHQGEFGESQGGQIHFVPTKVWLQSDKTAKKDKLSQIHKWEIQNADWSALDWPSGLAGTCPVGRGWFWAEPGLS